MNLTLQDLQREAATTGFPAETLEKAIRLVSLLNALRSHPFLKTRVALKGGTALNLFIFDVPRLSVDIDLNYVGAVDRETMLTERPKVEQAVQAVCSREGLTVKRAPSEHAGGKWRLTYAAASGRSGNLELDVNFMLRTPLWPAELSDSRLVGSFQATQVRLLELHELAAGKLAALLSRNASRDVFDACELLRRDDLNLAKLRLAFVVYGGANRKDWRTASIEDVTVDLAELNSRLIPTLRTGTFRSPKEVAVKIEEIVSDCRDLLSAVLPLTPGEREFIERLNGRGEITPELLTSDAAMVSAIRQHPALRWKAINVRKPRRRRGGGGVTRRPGRLLRGARRRGEGGGLLTASWRSLLKEGGELRPPLATRAWRAPLEYRTYASFATAWQVKRAVAILAGTASPPRPSRRHASPVNEATR